MPYYPPERKKQHSTQTIFQRSTPSARLIFNSMFVVVVLYCVKLFLKICFVQNPSLLSFSFPFVVFSILLSYLFILLEFSKCLMSQNIGCLVKAQLISLKKQHSNNFSWGQPMSSIDLQQYVCCRGPLLCQVFFEAICFPKILLSCPLLQLLSLTQFNSPGILSLISMEILWDFYNISMEIM